MRIKKIGQKFHLATVYADEFRRCEGGFGSSARANNEKAPKIALRGDDKFTAKIMNSFIHDMPKWMQEDNVIDEEYERWLAKVANISNNPKLWEPLPVFTNCNYVPRPWQEEPIRYFLTFKRGIAAIHLGGGKTGVAGAVAHHLAGKNKGKFRGLWVSIKSGDLLNQTYQELKFKFKFKNYNPVFLKGNTIKDKALNVEFEDLGDTMYMCNYEMFRPTEGSRTNPLIDAFLALPRINGQIFTIIVFDESSNLRNHTEHLRGLVAMRGGHWPTHTHQDPYRLAEYMMLLSGEPAPQSPTDWCHQQNMLHPMILPWNTVNGMKNAGAVRSMYSSVKSWSMNFLERLHKRVREFAYVLTRKDLEALGLKIPINFQLVKVEMTPVQARIYKEMQDDLVAWFEKQKKEIETEFSALMNALWDDEGEKPQDLVQQQANRMNSVAANMLVQILRLTEITGGYLGGLKEYDEWGEPISKEPPQAIPGRNPKLEQLIEDVTGEEMQELVEIPQSDGTVEVISKQKPAVIFARFRHEIALIEERLRQKNVSVGTIQGSQEKINQKTREDFQAGRIDCVVMNPASGKFGGNYQRASDAFYYDNSYKPEERTQSLGRLARDGQLSNVTVRDYACVGTIDLTVLSVLRRKKNISDLVLYKLPDFLEGRLTEEEEAELSGYQNDEENE